MGDELSLDEQLLAACAVGDADAVKLALAAGALPDGAPQSSSSSHKKRGDDSKEREGKGTNTSIGRDNGSSEDDEEAAEEKRAAALSTSARKSKKSSLFMKLRGKSKSQTSGEDPNAHSSASLSSSGLPTGAAGGGSPSQGKSHHKGPRWIVTLSPLGLACATSDAQVARLLLEAGADPNRADSADGRTAFHLACAGIVDSAGTGAALGKVDDEALMEASVELVRTFLWFGANPFARDSKDRTPLQMLGKFGDVIAGYTSAKAAPGKVQQWKMVHSTHDDQPVSHIERIATTHDFELLY